MGRTGRDPDITRNLLPTLRPLPHALGPLYQRLLCRSQTLDGCVELADPDLTHPGGQLGAASAHTRLCSQSGMGGKAPASRAWGRAPLRLFVSSPAWTSPPRALLPLPPTQRPLTGKTGLPIHLPTGNPRAAQGEASGHLREAPTVQQTRALPQHGGDLGHWDGKSLVVTLSGPHPAHRLAHWPERDPGLQAPHPG